MFRAGLILLLVAVAMAVAGAMGIMDSEGLAQYAQYVAIGGVGLMAVGFVIGLLTRGGSVIFGSRCARCKKKVRRGAIYCPDHLKETLQEAKEKYHREHGSGI